MAHFCKLGIGNIVEQVVVVSNDIATSEQAGVDFLNDLYKTPYDIWKQTSYNTRGNVHALGGTPFRKNYGAVGYYYDQTKDAFMEKKPFSSWVLNETTCQWNAPVAYPDDDKEHDWNEQNLSWDLRE
tara:strand:- start:1438 stop:1818 length:381 start_codon:yes stop_codon:yes gene_type:complete